MLVDAAETTPPTGQPVSHSKELCPAPLLVTKVLTGVKSYHNMAEEVLGLINEKSICQRTTTISWQVLTGAKEALGLDFKGAIY